MRVADVTLQIGIRHLLRLDLHVQRLLAVVAPRGNREALHDVQHGKRRNALAVRWHLPYRPAVIRGAYRLHPLRLKVGEIVGFKKSMLLPRELQHRLRCRPFVEAVPSTLANTPQGCRQLGIAKDLARRRRLAIRQKDAGKAGAPDKRKSKGAPVFRIRFRHHDAFLCQRRCRRHIFRHRKLAKTLPQRIPPRHRARHGHGIDARGRNFIDHALRLQAFDAHAIGRPAAGVKAIQLLRLRVIDDGEQIAPHAIHHWLDDSERSICGNRRIHSAAAPRQNRRARLRSDSLAGRHNAILRHHHGARLFAARIVLCR